MLLAIGILFILFFLLRVYGGFNNNWPGGKKSFFVSVIREILLSAAFIYLVVITSYAFLFTFPIFALAIVLYNYKTIRNERVSDQKPFIKTCGVELIVASITSSAYAIFSVTHPAFKYVENKNTEFFIRFLIMFFFSFSLARIAKNMVRKR